MDEPPMCLVAGATGYLGGRLVPALLDAGYRVRCLARDPGKVRGVPWAGRGEVATGDVLDPEAMARACAGVDVLYYLVHSLTRRGFAGLDRRAALVTAEAAREAGVSRIVYLGGLRPEAGAAGLSDHLASRAEVGETFLRGGVPSAVLQAAVIIGSGSASFEILRYLTERLPVMVTPTWVRSRVQPIAVRDVLHYLVAAAGLPAGTNRAFDIGGPDVLSYQDMMQRYAAVAGLPRRRMFPVRVLSPRLSAEWLNIVTPVPKAVGAPSDPLPSDPDWSGGQAYQDVRRRSTTASAEQLWRVVEGIGGQRGWYSFPLAWAARGWADRLVGGVGLRRGRRDPNRLRPGDALDWWRVERLEPGTLLRLRAEMKVPGLAWLELGIQEEDGGRATYRQRAIFVPRGLAGHLYWWSVAPFHAVVFGGMARNITRTAERS